MFGAHLTFVRDTVDRPVMLLRLVVLPAWNTE
jgi:hypothetical protein